MTGRFSTRWCRFAFYKIVIWKDGNEDPGAVGFLLEQGDLISALPEEAIDPGRFKIRQQKIADIQKMVDLNFGPVVDWDRTGAADPDELLDDGGRLITSLNDIKL